MDGGGKNRCEGEWMAGDGWPMRSCSAAVKREGDRLAWAADLHGPRPSIQRHDVQSAFYHAFFYSRYLLLTLSCLI